MSFLGRMLVSEVVGAGVEILVLKRPVVHKLRLYRMFCFSSERKKHRENRCALK